MIAQVGYLGNLGNCLLLQVAVVGDAVTSLMDALAVTEFAAVREMHTCMHACIYTRVSAFTCSHKLIHALVEDVIHLAG